MITVLSPSTGEVVGSFEPTTPAGIEVALDRAVAAQQAWAARHIGERADLLLALAATLRGSRERLAALASTEMGKPLREAMAEVEKCAWTCEVIADRGVPALRDDIVDGAGTRAWTAYQPLGVILAIMPWNFPYWQVVRAAVPALLAGNTMLVKHASNVTGSAVALVAAFAEAGFPSGSLELLVVEDADVPTITSGLIADDRIAAVTVTGSERAGMAVASAAGAAVKKSVLELGGSEPFIVLDDADVATTVRAAVSSRFLNNGQSCLSAKRFLVHESLVDEFTIGVAAAVRGLRLGDPLSPDTDLGPLARGDLLDVLEAQVADAIARGARTVVRGGSMIGRPGSWFAPVVLDRVSSDARVLTEETFGPVLAIVQFTSDEDAIRIARDTRFGLGASVWTGDRGPGIGDRGPGIGDPERGIAVGSRIQSGALFVNAVVASDPRHAFGGSRRSGYGRELGTAGVREFTNARTVVVIDSP